jgi:hypothetical protein
MNQLCLRKAELFFYSIRTTFYRVCITNRTDPSITFIIKYLIYILTKKVFVVNRITP